MPAACVSSALPPEPQENSMREIGHFVGGKEVKGNSGRFADVFNPNTGEVQAKVALASRSEMEHAIADAQAAQPGWAAINPQRRARVMFKFLDLVQKEFDSLAALLSSEHGKTVPATRALEDPKRLGNVGASSALRNVALGAQGRHLLRHGHIDELVEGQALGLGKPTRFVEKRRLKPQRKIALPHELFSNRIAPSPGDKTATPNSNT